MSRSHNKLTAATVRSLVKPGLYGDGGNLWLQVTASGAKTWVFRYSIDYKARSHGLGSANAFSLPEARKRASELRKKVADGIDPIEDRKARTASERAAALAEVTFEKCASDYIESHRPGWTNPKHAAQWQSTLDLYAKPIIGPIAVSRISLADVEKVLRPIWIEKTETASRLRGRIEQILDWATVRGLRSGENPARWRGHLDKLLPNKSKVRAVQHHPALDYRNVNQFLADLGREAGTASLAFKFLILTATRTNETLGARWDEIDLAREVWTIPAARMKARAIHRVPLSPAALAMLKVQAEASKEGFVFKGASSEKPLSNMALLMVLRRMKRSDVTAHGFRSTFRQWAAEATSYPREVAEMALAHTTRDKVEAAYQRGDLFEKRRKLMNSWASYCMTPIST